MSLEFFYQSGLIHQWHRLLAILMKTLDRDVTVIDPREAEAVFTLLAYVNCKPTKSSVSFTWRGAWEFDPMSGSGRVTLGKDGRLRGFIRIKDGDSSTFIAVRSTEPDQPIDDPPSYRDKWRRRR